MRLPQETSRRTALPTHWVTELFKKFQSRYLSKWTKPIEGIEEQAVQEWAIKLGRLNGDQLKHGLDTWNGDWPPSADEFLKCCLGELDLTGWEHKTAAYQTIPQSHRLTQKKADRETAKESMKEIRKKLGLGNGN